ncbi:MAG TPA: carotenoid biosynthesis protein, partial [Prolixibacteraceae bacterium]|nr:carotenoid biosynthesis protein [Prolixibacteraceae bacterium]
MKDRILTILMVLWYLGGIVGFLIPATKPLFQLLTPVGMVLATALLLFYHEPKNLKSGLFFAGVIVACFVVELIGVNTQLLFGNYQYGLALGFKLWNTPLVIGLNWLILIYCIALFTKTIRDRWYFPLVGASAMVAFDWVMEPVANATGMWNWEGGTIPLKNYMDWFLVSGFLFLMIRIL